MCMNGHYRRGSGGRGFISGAGETELELQRRRFPFPTLIFSGNFGYIVTYLRSRHLSLC